MCQDLYYFYTVESLLEVADVYAMENDDFSLQSSSLMFINSMLIKSYTVKSKQGRWWYPPILTSTTWCTSYVGLSSFPSTHLGTFSRSSGRKALALHQLRQLESVPLGWRCRRPRGVPLISANSLHSHDLSCHLCIGDSSVWLPWWGNEKWFLRYRRSDADSMSTNRTWTCRRDRPIALETLGAGLTMFQKWQSYHKPSNLCSGVSTSCVAHLCQLSMLHLMLTTWSPMLQVRVKWFEDYSTAF